MGKCMGKEFNKVYENNKNAGYSYLYYMTRDIGDAEDLCQDTFLKIYKNLTNFRGECNERSWCITIARNTFLSWAKKKKPDILEDKVMELIPVEGSNPEEVLLAREGSTYVKDILLKLKEEYRTIILLRDYEGLSYKEIGVITGLSESAVKVQIYRAREKFKKLFNENQSSVRR